MLIDSRIPELSDKELENLHGNAIRLAQAGTAVQRTEAERLLPIIGDEVEKRVKGRAIAMAEAREKRREAAAATRKRKAAEKAAAAPDPTKT